MHVKARALAAAAVVALLPAAASAQGAPPAGPLASVEAPMPAALRYLEAQGVKLTFLGEDGGLRGYLGESPTGKMQSFYVTPDGEHVVAGIMFRKGGINVTGVQVGEMQRRYELTQQRLGEARGALGAATPSSVEAPSIGEAAAPAEAAPAPALPPAAASDAPNPAEPWASQLDRDSFVAEVADVAWFSVGASDAPVVYMVVDPQCPFCHKAWERLKPMVLDRKLNIRVVMVGGLKGSRPLAISILGREDPGRAWFAGEGSVGGTKIAPAPAEDTKAFRDGRKYLDLNEAFAAKHRITKTPTLAYVGRDGKLYSATGLPEDVGAFLSRL